MSQGIQSANREKIIWMGQGCGICVATWVEKDAAQCQEQTGDTGHSPIMEGSKETSLPCCPMWIGLLLIPCYDYFVCCLLWFFWKLASSLANILFWFLGRSGLTNKHHSKKGLADIFKTIDFEVVEILRPTLCLKHEIIKFNFHLFIMRLSIIS
jgi:hypothetical protein